MKGKKTFIAWFLSYLVIVAFSAVLLAVVYILMAGTVSKQLMKINRQVLLRAETDIGTEIQNIDHLALQIALDPHITELAFRGREEIFVMVEDVREIISELKRLNAVTPAVQSIQILYANSGLVLSPEGIEALEEREEAGQAIRIERPFASGREFTDTGGISISVDNDYLADYLEGLEELSGGLLFLTDDDFFDLLPRRNRSGKELDFLRGEGGNSVFPAKAELEGGRYIIDTATLQRPGTRIVSFIPLNVFLSPLLIIRRISLAIFGFSIVLGFLASYYFTKRNYQPLKELVREVARRTPVLNRRGGWRGTEFDYVSDSLRLVYQQKNELLTTVREHKREIVNAYYSGLLKGNGAAVSEDETVRKLLDVPAGFSRMRVCVFDFDRNENEDTLLLPFFVQSAAEAITPGNDIACECIEVDGRTVLLFLSRDESADEAVIREMVRLHKILEEDLNITAVCVIGGPFSAWQHMNTAYEECINGLEYRFVYGPGSVIILEQLREGTAGNLYPIEKDLELVRCIRSGNKKGALAVVEELLYCGGPELPDVRWMKYCMYNTVGVIIKAAGTGGTEDGEFREQLVSRSGEIFNQLTYSEIRERISALVETACSFFESRKKSHNSELNERIISFIDDHLAEVNLCLTMIAETFGMNTKYLSRFYREQNGISINDYIHTNRLGRAKNLLAGDTSVKEIAERIGYGHIVTFIRVFKKHEGITPGKYRELYLNVPNG